MVYKRYLKKGGKVYGPYYYKSKRLNGKVVTDYVRHKPSPSFSVDKANFLHYTLGIFLFAFVGLLLFFSFGSHISFSPNDQTSLNLQQNYAQGQALNGTLLVNLQPGEIIPQNTIVQLTLNDNTQSIPLQNLISNQPISGDFHLSGSDLNGSGLGYGTSNDSNTSEELNIDLSSFNISAEQGTLSASLIYNDSAIVSTLAQINIESSTPTKTTSSSTQDLPPGAVLLTSCQTLNVQGQYYYLNGPISSGSYCLTIVNSGITIDCQGNTITFGTNGGSSNWGVGVSGVTSSTVGNNAVIKNCIIQKTNAGGSNNLGVYITAWETVFPNGITILNNTIFVMGYAGTSGIAAAGQGGAHSTKIYNVVVDSNNITTYSSSGASYGVLFGGTPAWYYQAVLGTTIRNNYFSVLDNSLASSGNIGITIRSYVHSMLVKNNTIFLPFGSNNIGIMLNGASTSDAFLNNTINVNGNGMYIHNAWIPANAYYDTKGNPTYNNGGLNEQYSGNIVNSSSTNLIIVGPTNSSFNVLTNQNIGSYSMSGGNIYLTLNTSYGRISFTGLSASMGSNLSSDLRMSNNFAHIASNIVFSTSGTKMANITLSNLPTNIVNPGILKNGVLCTDCTNLTSLNAGNVTFNIKTTGDYTIQRIRLMHVNLTYPINGSSFSSPPTNINFTVSGNIPQLCWVWDHNNNAIENFSCSNNLTLLGGDLAPEDPNLNTYTVYTDDNVNDYSAIQSQANPSTYPNILAGDWDSEDVSFNLDTRDILVNTIIAPVQTSSGYVNYSTITITATSDNSNLNKTTVTVYNSNWIVKGTNTTFAPPSPNSRNYSLSDGLYYINVTAFDFSNKNFSFPSNITIDTKAPNLVLSYSNTQGHVTASVSVNDTNPMNSLQVRLYNSSDTLCGENPGPSPIPSGSSSYSVDCGNIQTGGAYSLSATVTDLAGNTNSTIQSVVIAQPPRIQFVTPPTEVDGSYFVKNNIIASTSATGVNLANITVNLYDANAMPVTSSLKTLANPNSASFFVNFTDLTQGIYYFNATVYDSSSQNSATETRRVIIDPVPAVIFNPDTEINGSAYQRTNVVIDVNASHTNLTELDTYFFFIGGDFIPTIYTNNTPVNSTASLFLNLTNIGDGTYGFYACGFDIFGNSNCTENRTVYVDNSPPIFENITSTNALVNRNVNLSIGMFDGISGLSNATATIYYPNGSVQTYNMSLNGNMFNLTLYNMQLVGDYNVSYSVSDKVGNIASDMGYFDVYDAPLNVAGTVKDIFGNLQYNVNYTFFRPGTNIVLFSIMNATYNISADNLHERVYDLEARIGNDAVKLYNLNLTTNYIPITIDEFSGLNAQMIPKYKVLNAIGVNSTYVGNATVTLSYAPADLSDTNVQEAGITLNKCSLWDYSLRRCSDSFPAYTQGTLDNTNHLAIINTSSFSAFALTALTCGNGNFQPYYGETQVNCAGDYGSSGSGSGNTGSSGGSSGSGGGSGGGAGQLKVLQFSEYTIQKQIDAGQSITDPFVITNSLKTSVKATITFNGDASKVVSVASNKVELAFLNSTTIPLTILGNNEGVYSGNMVISTDTAGTYTVPITIIVKSRTDQLIDLSLSLDRNSISPGGLLPFKIKAFNLGQLSKYSVTLNYSVINKANNKILLSKEESAIIENSLILSRNVTLPKNASAGEYSLSLVAYYGGKNVTETTLFTVATPKGLSALLTNYLPLVMTIIVLVFIALIGLYYYFTLRKKLFQKKIEELRAKSIYPFPDFDALPKSGYAYIGQVADSLQSTYLDYTQLNRHTLIAGGTGSGKTVAGMVIVEELLKKGLSVVVFDPVGQWTGFAKKCEDNIMKSKYKKFGISGARAFKTTVFQINQENMNIDILKYVKNRGLTILRLDGLNPKDADRFIEVCLEKIYRARLSETSSLRYLLVLDEVHRLLPKYGGRKAYVKLEQAVREFRKWGIGLLMISQVLTDFKGAVRGNIGTEIQMHSRFEGDIKRVRERHGSTISKLVSKMPIGLGMVEASSYNRGSPYFVEFRPVLHSPFKLTDQEMISVRRESAMLSKEPFESFEFVGRVHRSPAPKEEGQQRQPSEVHRATAGSLASTPSAADINSLLAQADKYISAGQKDLATDMYRKIKSAYDSMPNKDAATYQKILDLYNKIVS